MPVEPLRCISDKASPRSTTFKGIFSREHLRDVRGCTFGAVVAELVGHGCSVNDCMFMGTYMVLSELHDPAYAGDVNDT